MRVHFWSRTAVPENPMLHANIMALCLIERKSLLTEVLHCGNKNFLPYWLLWPWPCWPDDLHIWPWPAGQLNICCTCKYELRTSRILKVIVWQTYRHTDTTKIIHHAASRVVNNLSTWTAHTSAKAKLWKNGLHRFTYLMWDALLMESSGTSLGSGKWLCTCPLVNKQCSKRKFLSFCIFMIQRWTTSKI